MKLKLSIYNTILMITLVAVVLWFLISISGNVIEASSRAILESVITENIDEIEYDDGELEFDDIDFYENQVASLIYSADGILLKGSVKEEILEPLVDGQIKTVEVGENTYLIYDVLTKWNVYIRGVISISNVSNTLTNVFKMAFWGFPIFIGLSAIGSYFICKKSLEPLEKMLETAEKISKSDDLSLRIGEIKQKDELARLATTFDKMMARLETVINAEKQFTSDVSHELRTPVAVILGECEVAQNSTDEEKNQALIDIKSQSLKITCLINHLLNMIRLENGTLKPEVSEVYFTELVEEFCEEKEVNIPKNIKLSVDCQKDIVFTSDYSMLVRILTNLIENSIKYIGTGKTINVELKENEKEIILAVSDDGIGIDESEIDKIFNRFYRVDKSRTENSMGIGLSMVKQMAEHLEATIELESKLTEGSKFKIIFRKEGKL